MANKKEGRKKALEYELRCCKVRSFIDHFLKGNDHTKQWRRAKESW